MGDTVADLVLGTSVDPSGITAGLSAVHQTIERTLSQSNGVQAGASIATDLIAGLKRAFDAEQGTLSEQVVKGIISPGAFALASAEATDEFKHGLSHGLGQLAVEGKVTDAIRQQFEEAYGSAGASAGQAFDAQLRQAIAQSSVLIEGLKLPTTKVESTAALQAQERGYQAALLAGNLDLEQRVRVTQDLTRVQQALADSTAQVAGATSSIPFSLNASELASERLGGSVRRTSAEFFGLGGRAAHAAVGISFALADLAQNADNAQGPIREILHSISLIAIGFGEPGLLVSAIAAGTDAIIGIFQRTRDEMAKTQKDFSDKLRQMENQADVLGETAQLQQLLQGQRGAGPSKLVPTEFAGGLDDLRAKLADTQHQLDNITTADLFTKGLTFPQQLKDQIADLNKQIAPLAAQEKKLRDSILNPAPTLQVPIVQPPVVSQAVTPLEKLQATVDHLTGSAPLAAAALAALPNAFVPIAAAQDNVTTGAERFVTTYNRDVLAAFDAVNRAIAKHGPIFDETTAKLAAMRQQLAGLDVVKVLRILQPTTVPTITVTAQIESVGKAPDIAPIAVPISFEQKTINDLLQHLGDVQQAIQATQAAGLGHATSDELKDQQDTLAKLDTVWQAYVKVLIAAGASTADLARAQKNFDDAVKQSGANPKPETAATGLAAELEQSGEAIRRIGDSLKDSVLTNLGAAIQSAGELAKAFQQMQASGGGLGKFAASLPGFVGAIGGIFGALDSLFSGGPSPAMQALQQAMQANVDAVDKLRASIDRMGDTGRSLDRLSDAVAHLDTAHISFLALQDNGIMGGNRAFDELNRELAGTGVTFAQLKAEADKLGITLLDSAGHVIPGALFELQQALGVTARSLTTLSDSFDEQKRISDLLNRANGNTSPLNQLTSDVARFKGASPQLGQFFSDLDTSTAAGRDRVRDNIAKLAEQIRNGDIKLSQLGSFGSVDEVEAALSTLLDDLDAFGNGLDKATNALLNVPQGFKVAAARWAATLPTIPTPPTPSGPPPSTITPEPPIAVPMPITTTPPRSIELTPETVLANNERIGEAIATALRPLLDQSSTRSFMQDLANEIAHARSGGDTYIFDVTIDGSTLTADEILQAVRKAAQAKARALFGTTARAAETLNV